LDKVIDRLLPAPTPTATSTNTQGEVQVPRALESRLSSLEQSMTQLANTVNILAQGQAQQGKILDTLSQILAKLAQTSSGNSNNDSGTTPPPIPSGTVPATPSSASTALDQGSTSSSDLVETPSSLKVPPLEIRPLIPFQGEIDSSKIVTADLECTRQRSNLQ
jgi:uncharacterized coiled-coil protein SlyX